MKIFVSAAEISSDLQAEKIIRELIRLFPNETVEIAGIGGPRLRALPNFKTVESAENLRAMGFTEVLGKIFAIKKILNHAISFLEAYRPDVLLTFDYPDFHFALMKACAKIPALANTTRICGIPPKVWVWRSKRIDTIRKLYHAVWVLFPFEKELYEDAGIPVIYEGNPLIAEVLAKAKLQKNFPTKPEWETSETITLAVMPGSREAEIKAHLEVIPETLHLLSEKVGKKIIAEVPVPHGIPIKRISAYLKDSSKVSYRFTEGASAEVLARNSIGLIKSGTSTLEAATLGCVPIIFYRVSLVTRLIFQFLIRYEGAVGLPNILLGIKKRNLAVFPEFLGPEATPSALALALFMLIESPDTLRKKQEAGRSLREMLVPRENISVRIAEQIKKIVDEKVKASVVRVGKPSTVIASFLWSTLNRFRRKIYDLGILKSETISLPSVLVGNLQAGGAGKTPVVIAIAGEAEKRGYRVGVVSRGYGGNFKSPFLIVSEVQHPELRTKPEVIGDEPAEIIEALPNVILGLGADRVKISKELERLGINFLIFDDGFQNLKFKTQNTVLVVSDALPSEVVFRDFITIAERADLIVQTKGLPKLSPVPALKVEWDVGELPKSPIWLLCGVADPSEVAQFYRNLGVQIDRVIRYADHAKYDVTQVRHFEAQAKSHGAVLAVTSKDWIKLKSDSSLTPFILRRKIRAEGWLESLFKR